MAYKVLVIRCPKTEKNLEFGERLPLDDRRYPTQVHVKSLHLPFDITRCPECGESHAFAKEEEIREVIVPEEKAS